MKRGAIVFGVLAVLLIGNGWYLIATNNNVGGDTGYLFGNQHHFLSAGQTVLISGFLLAVPAIVMWTVAWLRRDRGPATADEASQVVAAQAQAQVAPAQGENQKELSDQREA
jgi:dolichyl-phosphate-mannose--protein O-mannosyl transferase